MAARCSLSSGLPRGALTDRCTWVCTSIATSLSTFMAAIISAAFSARHDVATPIPGRSTCGRTATEFDKTAVGGARRALLARSDRLLFYVSGTGPAYCRPGRPRLGPGRLGPGRLGPDRRGPDRLGGDHGGADRAQPRRRRRAQRQPE